MLPKRSMLCFSVQSLARPQWTWFTIDQLQTGRFIHDDPATIQADADRRSGRSSSVARGRNGYLGWSGPGTAARRPVQADRTGRLPRDRDRYDLGQIHPQWLFRHAVRLAGKTRGPFLADTTPAQRPADAVA